MAAQLFTTDGQVVGHPDDFWAKTLRWAGISRHTNVCRTGRLRLLDTKFSNQNLRRCKPLVLELFQHYGRGAGMRIWSNDIIGFQLPKDLEWAWVAEPRQVYYLGEPEAKTRTFTWLYPEHELVFVQTFEQAFYPWEKRPDWPQLYYTGIFDEGSKRKGRFQILTDELNDATIREIK